MGCRSCNVRWYDTVRIPQSACGKQQTCDTTSFLISLPVCSSDIDLGIASIIDPANGCGLGDEAVTVKIRNYGGVPQSDIPVNYQLDGGAVVSETWIGTLDPGETVEYTFKTLGDFSALGDHDLVAWTSFPGDTIPEMILLMRSLPIFGR